MDVAGKAVLLHTGWSRYWGEDKYPDHPFISNELALRLKDGKPKLVGVDFLTADDRNDPRRPAHVNLLYNDILIVENLTNLDQLVGQTFVFHAVPIKIAKVSAFPVRAYAVVTE
jgi:kynurenine formamidase